MITEKADIIGVSHSEPSIHVNDWKIKDISYLNYNNDGLGSITYKEDEMITKEAYVIGVTYSDFPIYANDDWRIKGIFYLNYNDNTLGLLPIRRIK